MGTKQLLEKKQPLKRKKIDNTNQSKTAHKNAKVIHKTSENENSCADTALDLSSDSEVENFSENFDTPPEDLSEKDEPRKQIPENHEFPKNLPGHLGTMPSRNKTN